MTSHGLLRKGMTVLMVWGIACSDNKGDPGPEAGGTLGSGGAPGTGGDSMTGGGPGSGGEKGTGGKGEGGEGSGGKTATETGGQPGSGGAVGRDAGRDLVSASGGTVTDARPGSGGAGGTTSTGTSAACTVGSPLSGGTSHCSSNASGNMSGGYSWTIWSSGGGGCIITYNEGCAFKATWNNSGDFLARAGLGWNSTQTYDQMGTISADYAFTKTGTGGGYSYIGIYGWSKSPLLEYYIVDDWYSKPNPGSKVGTITVDDATYTVYKSTRVNQPSIEGTSTFDQFFSVRQTARQCGHISISKHFEEWSKLGLKLGKMYEARILVEAGGGSGSLDFTKATLTAVK